MGATGLVLPLLFLFVALFATEGRAEKIRTAIPQATLNYLSVYVAEAKGFLRDEGLENETIVISGPRATAALVSGDVDYSGAGGSGMRAAVIGAALKVVMFQTERVTWYLATDSSIMKASDLKGKKIAVGSIGDTQDRLTTLFVERAGLVPGDITRITMGTSTMARILAVKTGAVQAATMDPGGVTMAEKEGLKTLAFLGDLFPFPFQGFVTTDKKIAENSAQIRRWLRAMVRGLMFLRERPEESTAIGMKKLQLGNITSAMLLDGVKRYVRALPEGVPGMPSQEGIKNMLEYDVRLPMNLKEQVAPEKVLNLKFMEEIKKEFETKRANR
ncbi:MAG TPA: ABC transporter substrate-binding protein [Candidatus Binatia bacterium]|jgi:NitT/TauT family transport system substrate-binding protein